jgi:hypothetical protein
MKYIKYREDFVKSRNNDINSLIVNEAFENDITWGGSILGRLINSTIRSGKVLYKTTRVNSLVKEFEKELLNLVAIASADEETQSQIESVQVKLLIEAIYKIVVSDASLDSKLTQLIGDKSEDSGLIQATIKIIEGIDDSKLSGKQELITKLKNFRDALMKENFDIKEEEESQDSNTDNNSEDDSKKKIFNFYVNTSNLMKSAIEISNTISNKRITVAPNKEATPKSNPKDSNNNMVSDLAKPSGLRIVRGGAGDSNDNKKDDKKDGDENTETKNENVSNINNNETHTKTAWSKIKKAFDGSNISKNIENIKNLIVKSKAGEKLDKKVIIAIGKQIIANEATIGKPLSFEQMIKEEAGVIPNEYQDISKSMSLLARVLLAFKDDMGLLDSLGELKKPITTFIKCYDELKKSYEFIKGVEKEPVKNEFKLINYDRFMKLNEADDVQEEETDESTDKDIVKTEWYKEFKEGEEKEWKIEEKTVKELQKKTEATVNKEFSIDPENHMDSIIKIVNIFGKAYKLYAVEVIPSGRPNGRISQKTFRQYTFIGNSDKQPEWSKDTGPSSGPWASNSTFEKWENGIMKILEDTKYRKVLANAKFKNKGPNQKAGSGKTLFKFINDMLGEGGKDRNFRSKRHRLMTEYFDGYPDIDKKTKGVEPGEGKIDEEDYGDKKEFGFYEYSRLGRGIVTTTSFYKEEYDREFFKISYRENDGKLKYLIGFVQGTVKGPRSVHGGVVIKFHKSDKKQSIISSYLKNTLDSDDNKLVSLEYNSTQDLYVGVINIDEFRKFRKDSPITIKFAEVTSNNTYGTIEEMKINFQSIYALGRFDPAEGKITVTKVEGKPDTRPKYDIIGLDKIKYKKEEFGIS